MALDLSLARCVLFVPGHRPDRFDKARAASPDGIIIDLEDAVPAAEKAAARTAIAAYLGRAGRAGAPVGVRVNALGTRAALDDLAGLADGALAADYVVVPKVESARDIAIVRALLPDPAACPVMAVIETARGIEEAAAVAAALGGLGAVGFGGADLAADLDAAFAWEPLLWARCRVVQAAAAGRVPAFDVPYLDVRDDAGLTEETRRARALGFSAKLAIHPAQVAPILAALRPDAAEIEMARRIVAGFAAAGGAAVAVDGHMIDQPVYERARRLLARAERNV